MTRHRGSVAWLVATLACVPMASLAQDAVKKPTADSRSPAKSTASAPAQSANPGAAKPAGTKDSKEGSTKKPAPAAPTSAAESEEVDDELLEFLGSVDSEDQEMMDYLAQSDESPGAKAKATPSQNSRQRNASQQFADPALRRAN